MLLNERFSTEMLKIDSDIPVPSRSSKYPFESMEVGDSIHFALEKPASSARVASIRFVDKFQPEWKFLLRKASDKPGWRLWRVQ